MRRHTGWIAFASTLATFGLLGWLVVNAPNWDRVQASFFSGEEFADALPAVAWAFRVNVQIFLIAEVLTLGLGLGIAILRSLPGPVFMPVRLLAIAYVDIFRALPGVLVIFFLGLGVPSLRIEGVPKDPFVWGIIVLTLIYGAYVSEVYRAGIESIHPSQEAAARSLGLSRSQAMRYVILPQAIRRVVPPLLNDFIGLQKDTVLISFIGVIEIFRAAQIRQAAHFNFTPYLAVAFVFLVLTLPLTRLTDWLIARDRARSSAGART